MVDVARMKRSVMRERTVVADSLHSSRTTTPWRQVAHGPRQVLDIYSSIGDYVQTTFNNNEAGDQGRQTCPFEVALERREAQRFGGEASQASRSPLARASGWASQTRPCKARTPSRSQGAGQGASQAPGASRRSISLFRGSGKR